MASLPRYGRAPLPPYAYRPGRNPHPRRDSRGHSVDAPEPRAPEWHPGEWATLAPWLDAVDLFNRGFWWEAHEQLEALWLAAGRTSPHARFVQGVLKVAAACLHADGGNTAAAASQARSGADAVVAAAQPPSQPYMGVDVPAFIARVAAYFVGGAPDAPVIELSGPSTGRS